MKASLLAFPETIDLSHFNLFFITSMTSQSIRNTILKYVLFLSYITEKRIDIKILFIFPGPISTVTPRQEKMWRQNFQRLVCNGKMGDYTT